MKRGLLIVFVFAFIVTLCIVSLADAEISIKDYDEVKNAEWFKIYINGVGIGITWANIAVTDKGQPLYCPPKKLALGAEDYLRIVQDSIEKNKTLKEKMPTYPIEILLLRGLIEKFPCKN